MGRAQCARLSGISRNERIENTTLPTSAPPPRLPQIGLMSVTMFPVRLLLMFFFMLLAWPFAFVASLGRSELAVEPQSWWRRCVCTRALNNLDSQTGNE